MINHLKLAAIAAALLAAGLAECRGADSAPSTQPVSTTQPSALTPENLDMLETVFRYMLDQYGGRTANVYLSLDEGKDPPPALLSRFDQPASRVLAASMSEIARDSSVIHKKSGKRGILLTIWAVQRVDDQTMDVFGGYYIGNLGAEGSVYRVTKTDGKWIVQSCKQQWIS